LKAAAARWEFATDEQAPEVSTKHRSITTPFPHATPMSRSLFAEIKNYAVRPEGVNDQPEPHVHFWKLICSAAR